MAPSATPLRRRASASLVVGLTMVGALLLSGCSGAAGTSGVDAAGGGKADAAVTAPATPSAALTHTSGSVLGGTETITGNGLADVAHVAFGDDDATITKQSDTKLTVTVPAAKDYQPGDVAVVLTDKNGAAVAATPMTYSYTADTPVGRQMAYALKHWKNYNSAEYGDLNPVGGDCANFVSQTLIARGWKMNADWYNHDAAADWSPTWGYTPAMDDYFAAHAKELGLERLSQDQLDKVSLGDIGIFDWEGVGNRDHTMVVDRITHEKDGTIKVAFASHNNDGAYRDLAYTITKQHPGAKMHFWHFVDPTAVGGGQ